MIGRARVLYEGKSLSAFGGPVSLSGDRSLSGRHVEAVAKKTAYNAAYSCERRYWTRREGLPVGELVVGHLGYPLVVGVSGCGVTAVVRCVT